MKRAFLSLAGFLVFGSLMAQDKPEPSLYGTGVWNADSLGNHRVVVTVDKPVDAVLATMDWRRRDSNPEDKNLIVVDAKTGERVMNVTRFTVNREKGEVVFQPQTVPGKYYIYYLKNIMSGSRNYPTVTYPAFEQTASEDWLKANKLTGKKVPKLQQAGIEQYQAINEFNSFYPMEVIATEAEKETLLKAHPSENYILFTEDRRFPIRMTTDIPYKWIEDNRHDHFEGTADKGEYYTFQLGVWAARQDIHHLNVVYSPLMNKKTGETIPASAFTCFNTEGIDVTGTVFEKDCSVSKNKVQALWIGAMVPEQLASGDYEGTVMVSAEGVESKTVDLTIHVSENVIANHGDNEPWRHSRLRWLNSSIGMDDEVVAPYIPLKIQDKTISLLGRNVKLATNGLPQRITSLFKETITEIGEEEREILAQPMALKADGGDWQNMDFEITKRKPATIGWHSTNQNNLFIMNLDAQIESDGNMTYKIVLIARENAEIQDIALQTVLAPGIGHYMMGLGQKGGFCPKELDWKWDVQKNQDAIWTGDVNAGLQLRFYDDKYERPLNTNFYHKKPLRMPVSWANAGNGGIKLSTSGDNTLVNAYSGKRTIKKGDRLCFYFNVLITPFRTINTDKQWQDRYYHAYDFMDKIDQFGASVINIHHATTINPFINYPFLRPKQMKAYIDGAHALGKKVKIYNTVRELSNSCVEMFALRSLGNEIFSEGPGGGFSWLQEHLDQNYIGAWFVPHLKDAAIVNSGISRWHNYYMEGLDWLVKNVGIDGLYIDDLAFDRTSMKRVRKILNRTNPGAMLDLHSANQYNKSDGFANSANLYLEHFPYLDRLWFGEYFDYDMPPEFWIVEVSGIPYGLMGEMLWNGGNKWRGMLYGMTARCPWNTNNSDVDNRPLWKFWDEFGMKGSKMIGYWVSDNPVKTGKDKTLATVYCKKGEKTLISLATWEDQDAEVTLTIDWEKLGLDPAKVTLHAPAIEKFQPEKNWKPGEKIIVPKGQGWLIVAE